MDAGNQRIIHVVPAGKGQSRQANQALGLAWDRVAVGVGISAPRTDRQKGNQRLGLKFPLPAPGFQKLRHALRRGTRVTMGSDFEPHSAIVFFR